MTMKVIVLFVLISLTWGNPVQKKTNPMLNEGLFEGDIMGIDPNEDRNAVPRDSQRWPNGVVPYEIDPSLYPMWDLIQKSIRHIEDNSCLKFVQRTNERDYVKMVKDTGCWSHWGRLGTGQQQLSLGAGCEYFGVVVHELMHAIGFEHEHNRSDRDEYLTIHWENIENQWFSAFNKLRPDQNRLLGSFDYDSIMMYGEQSFSRGYGLKSMSARDGRFLPEAYNKPGLSKNDAVRLRTLYGCPR